MTHGQAVQVGRRVGVAIGAAAAVMLGLSGCVTERIAQRIAGPTNGGREAIPTSAETGGIIDSWGLVAVGPPGAELAYFVIEPGPHVAYRFDPADPDHGPAEALLARPGVRRIYSIHMRFSRHDGPPARDRPHMVIARPTPEAPPPPPRGTILMLQGWGGSATALPYLQPLAASLAHAGYRVVMPDLRGQGLSTGQSVGVGGLDVRDLRRLIDRLRDRGVVVGPIGVVGHSYGGGVGILLAAADPRIEAGVSLSPWHDWIDAAPVTLPAVARMGAPALYYGLSWLVSDATLRRAARRSLAIVGVEPAEALPIAQLPGIETPLLLIHGTADPITRAAWSRQLYRARPAHTALLLLRKSNHWDYFTDRWPTLRGVSVDWLDQQLEAANQRGRSSESVLTRGGGR